MENNFINKDIIPLIITIALVLISIIVVMSTNVILNQKHYLGFGLVFISLFLYFKQKDSYIFVFSIFLLAGLIGVLDVFYLTYQLELVVLKLNPIFLLLFILFISFNRDKLNSLFPEKDNIEKDETNLISHFENKFKNKTNEELMKMKNNKQNYTKDATIAIENLLKK